MTEIAKYNNDMNDIQFSGFSPMHHNIFMAICSKMKDQGTKKVTFTFNQLRELAGMDIHNYSNQEFVEFLKDMNEKLGQIKIETKDEQVLTQFTLFPTFKTYLKKHELVISINEEFTYLLNNLSSYTQFELSQFTDLKSKYSKTLYKKLRQFKATGLYRASVEEFRHIMCVPEQYQNKRVMEKIIKPAIQELSERFEDLRCEPIYSAERGKPLKGYDFKFRISAMEAGDSHRGNH